MPWIIVFLILLIIPSVASWNIHNTYNKYKMVKNGKKLSGFEVARKILDRNGLTNVYIVENPNGELSDCYDSSRKTVRLSTDVYHGETIAAVAVAAHECGHAIQDKEAYAMLRVRSMLFPVVNIGTRISYLLITIGILFRAFDVMELAVIVTALALAFQLVTLPVEFNASERAKKILLEEGITTVDENVGVSKVLQSAALTYVAAVLTTLIQMIYYLLRYANRR